MKRFMSLVAVVALSVGLVGCSAGNAEYGEGRYLRFEGRTVDRYGRVESTTEGRVYLNPGYADPKEVRQVVYERPARSWWWPWSGE